MTTNKKNLIAVLGVLILGACSQASAGMDYITKSYELTKFNKITNMTSIDIDVRVGEGQSVSVKADKKYLEHLIIEVKNNTLIVKKNKSNSKSWGSWGRNKNKITVTVEELNSIKIKGSSDIKAHNIKADEMDVQIFGSGDVEIDGTCKDLDISIKGSGDVKAKDFSCKNVIIGVRGSGDVALTGKCSDLKVDVRGSGDVNARRYKCSTVAVSIRGSGDVTAYASQAVQVDLKGSGDVSIYGSPKKTHKDKKGSGDISIH